MEGEPVIVRHVPPADLVGERFEGRIDVSGPGCRSLAGIAIPVTSGESQGRLVRHRPDRIPDVPAGDDGFKLRDFRLLAGKIPVRPAGDRGTPLNLR